MNLKPRAVLGVVMMAAIFAFVAAPLQAQTPEYGGIGATTPSFYAANPHRPGKPPAGITYYRGCVIGPGRDRRTDRLAGSY